jgi:N-acyl-L-homoserine lactone synthetase
MLRQILGYERDKFPNYFDQMFRQRKTVLHDLKRWDVRVVDDHFEIDEYDRDDTVYLMSFNSQNELVGSIRLISTTTPHMMSGPFRAMFPGFDFSSPLIWEATRFVVFGDRETQPNGVSTAACELLLGMVQFALQNGVRHFTGVYEAGMPRLYRRCGLNLSEMGRHRTADHGTVLLGLWEISEALEGSILAKTGLGAPKTYSLAALAA